VRADLTRITPDSLDRAVITERIKEFRQRLHVDPAEADARYGLGVAYHSLGLLDDAVRELGEAVRLQPENVFSRLHLAVVLADLAASGRPGAPEAAWRELNHVLRLQPDLPDAFLLRARLLTLRHQWDDALTALDRAHMPKAEHQQRRAWVYLNRAEDALRRGAWSEAITCWRQTAEGDPNATRTAVSQFLLANEPLALAVAREAGFVPAPRFVIPTGRSLRSARLAVLMALVAIMAILLVSFVGSPLAWLLLAGGFSVAAWHYARRAKAEYPADPAVKRRDADVLNQGRSVLRGEGLTTGEHVNLASRVAAERGRRDRAALAIWQMTLPIELGPAGRIAPIARDQATLRRSHLRRP
jgi:tetratricopeptide (TPR) repeat protein